MKLLPIVTLAGLAAPFLAVTTAQNTISTSVPASDVFEAYVSYSIEFSSFPDFAGNNSHPNTFSDNLLDNLKHITGVKPYIRVGGNTQDYALYDASLPVALNGTFDPKRSEDYPTTIFIGPSYFESYNTFRGVKYSHGFNLGLGGNNSAGWQTLIDTVPLACKALSGKLYLWGYGNEPDLFSTSAQGPVRPISWNEREYVWQWHNGTRVIKTLIQEHCPELAADENYGYLAPSHAGVANRLKAPAAWAAGINADKDVKLFSTHNYISGATSPGVTLQGTLMNHTVTRRSVDAHVTEYNAIKAIDPSAPPMIFGETNSLYNQGRPGLSNTFGAALWVADFNLYSASVGFKRVQMHMGTNYRYGSWQPITTHLSPKGTKAPYYGNVLSAFATSAYCSLSTVEHIPLSNPHLESAYAIYTKSGTRLSRIAVLNLRNYNTTVDGAGLVPLPSLPTRGSKTYNFTVPAGYEKGYWVGVRRLLANGSDAITGITWDGYSFNYELDFGKPVRLGNVTHGEKVQVGEGGSVSVEVVDSSAVVLDFEKCW